jgi:hypothetical protein
VADTAGWIMIDQGVHLRVIQKIMGIPMSA